MCSCFQLVCSMKSLLAFLFDTYLSTMDFVFDVSILSFQISQKLQLLQCLVIKCSFTQSMLLLLAVMFISSQVLKSVFFQESLE